MTSQIAKFYAGRSVFITGGSGFVGKQLIEKLLRSCPEIDKIFLLMRAKKGFVAKQRLQQTLASPIFDVLRARQPDFSKKLVPIGGDIVNDFLGISDADCSLLSANTSIVIHSAATLSFVEPLRVAVDMNVLGVRRALDVSKQLPHLEAFVHISTAYSQVDKYDETIQEKVYDPPVSAEKIIAMTRLMTDDELAELTPYLLRKHRRPNTYTFTKAIAERLVQDERGHVPVSIVRPSIITASQAEPFPGWVDNFAAANGVYGAFGTGTLRSVKTEKPKGQSMLDVIPVDRVANGVLITAWQTAVNRFNGDLNVPVYNMTSQGHHLLIDTTSLMLKNSRRYPYSKLHPPRYSITGFPACTNSWPMYKLFNGVYLTIRFHVMDMLLVITGKKPRLAKFYEKSQKLAEVLTFFTSNEFVWEYNRMMKVYREMSTTDQKEFNCILNDLDKETYYTQWWIGMKKYALKDPAMNSTHQLPAVDKSRTVDLSG